jgi:hypothetical protein
MVGRRLAGRTDSRPVGKIDVVPDETAMAVGTIAVVPAKTTMAVGTIAVGYRS